MLWKVVAVLITAIFLFGTYGDLQALSDWHLYDYYSYIPAFLGVAGLLSYSFKFKVWDLKVWNIANKVVIIDYAYHLALGLMPSLTTSIPSFLVAHNFKSSSAGVVYVIVMTLIYIPLVISTERLSSNKKK